MTTRINTILIMAVMFGLFAGCSEDETQTTEQSVADSGAGDTGINERADGANSADASSADASSADASSADASAADASAADASESDTGQVDSGQVADAGVQDAGITDDAMPDAGDTRAAARAGAGQSPPSGLQIDVDGTMREYHISMPDNYDASRPHKLIFVFHGLAVPLNANWGVIFLIS